MGISQFVLQDGFAVRQVLHLVGEGVEGLDQLLDQLRRVHPAATVPRTGQLQDGLVAATAQHMVGMSALFSSSLSRRFVGGKSGKKEEKNDQFEFLFD